MKDAIADSLPVSQTPGPETRDHEYVTGSPSGSLPLPLKRIVVFRKTTWSGPARAIGGAFVTWGCGGVTVDPICGALRPPRSSDSAEDTDKGRKAIAANTAMTAKATNLNLRTSLRCIRSSLLKSFSRFTG